METILNSNTKTARLAAAVFFFVGMPLSLWGQSYVLSKVIFVPQDPVATAHNLLANEFLFRLSIVGHLVDKMLFVTTVLLFYRIFRPVDKFLSLFMVVAVLVQIPIVFMNEVFNFTALMILKSDARSTFDVAQQQEAAYILLRMHAYATGVGMGKLFVGLCFIPFGILVYRSRLAPRIIGILLVIGGVGYVADCCVSILLQRPDYLMVRSFLMYTTFAWLLAQLWFLIKGVHEDKANLIPQQE